MSFDPAATRPIGRRALAVSQLGVGTLPFGSTAAGDTDASIAAAFAAMNDAGLRYFDTAPFYGLGIAEHRLGTALRTVDRREVVVSSKVGRLLRPVHGTLAGAAGPAPGSVQYAMGAANVAAGAANVAAGAAFGDAPFEVAFDYSYDGTLRSLEHSLQRLGTNQIDIALIHDVNRRWQGDRVEQRYREAMDGAHRALSDLRSQGVVKAFGVGVNDWSILMRFAADGDFDCFMLAGRYTLLDHSALDTFMPDCERRGIAVLMAAPFNSGILATGAAAGATYFYQPAEASIVERTRRIESACARHGVALAAAALQFPLAHPAVASVVAGMRSASEVEANLAHCRADIPAAFWSELRQEGLIAAHAPVPGGQ